MSLDAHLVLQHVNKGAAYLWNPPCDSWVSSFASVFFVMAIVVVSPVVLLLALDFTSYAIVRTLGIEHAHPASSKSPELLTPASDPSQTTSRLAATKRPSNISIPAPSIILQKPDEYFTTPGGGNYQLSGVGIFSPPGSRTPSPPITRRSTKESFSMRHASSPISLGTIIDVQSEADVNSEQGRLPSQEAPTEEGSNVLPVNGGEGHARNDSSDDDHDTPSQVLLRRRKPGLPTPPDT